MTVADVLDQLEAKGSEKMREMHRRNGYSGLQFGVKMGDIRSVAKPLKTNPELSEQLWQTGNLDAQLVAILIAKPSAIPADRLAHMVSEATLPQLADWLNSYVVRNHPDRERLRTEWMNSLDPMLARSGWSLTADRIAKDSQGLDLSDILDRIEREMAGAPAAVQWTMNFALGHIGIYHPGFRERAVEIGERLGIYRDYPTSKGCTSPFVPLWVAEMVRRSEG